MAAMRPTNPLMLARASRTCTASRIARTSYRSYSDASYPFTKPANTPTKKSPSPAPNAAWPFTKPNSPVSVAPPSGKVDDQRPGPAMESSELIDREAVATDELHPDYAIVEDYTTSTFSPVPFRIQDGSDPDAPTPAAITSGAPVDLQARTVRIFKPTKPATQSGDWHAHHWRMDWDVMGKGHRWENPLMGWQSSGDYMQATHLDFATKDQAIHFAEKQGYEYFVQEPNERKFVVKQYANQFLHVYGDKMKQVRTK